MRVESRTPTRQAAAAAAHEAWKRNMDAYIAWRDSHEDYVRLSAQCQQRERALKDEWEREHGPLAGV